MEVNSNQIVYEGSDEEIRIKITNYLSSLLQLSKTSIEAVSESPKKPEYIPEYGNLFFKAWQQTQNYNDWFSRINEYQFSENIKSCHPCHGAPSQLSSQFAAKMSEFGKSMMSQQSKSFQISKDETSKSIKQTSLLFSSVGSYMKKIGKSLLSEEEPPTKDKDEFEVVNLND